MPITIKELLAADTISQAADKINSNFDQLLLNGGGPTGPPGPIGLPGPIGGRGLRGTIWFEDPAVFPGTDPNTLIFVDVLEGDSYLQSNGDVWEYNGITWILTSINLRGPQGPAGSGSGFDYFNLNGASLNGERAAYPGPFEVVSGANLSNEGVSAVMIGGVVSITFPDPVGFTSAYLIDDQIAKTIQSDTVSLFVHQKDSSTQAIKFHGGGLISSDNFEQTNIGNLSNIKLGEDDRLIINVPKKATSPNTLSDLIGFGVETFEKSQRYESGKSIQFITGGSTTPSGFIGEISDFIIDIDESNSSNPAKFEVGLRPSSYNSILQLGGGITVSPIVSYTPIKTGTFYLETGDSYLYASLTNTIGAVGEVNIRSKTSSININSSSSTNVSNSGAGGINITQTASTGDIQLINQGNANIDIISQNGNINLGGVSQNGNIVLNGNGNQIVLTTSVGNISISNTGGNVVSTAVGSITSTASTDITETAGRDIAVDAGRDITETAVRDIVIEAGRDISLDSQDTISADAQQNINLTAFSGSISISNNSTSNGISITSDVLQTNITALNDPSVKITGYLSPDQGPNTAVGFTDAKDLAIISHSYKATVSSNDITLNWIKVGGIIHVSGQVTLAGTSAVIDLPFQNNDGTDGVSGVSLPITSLFGQGIWNDGANMYPIHVVVNNLDIQQFCFFQNQSTGSPIPTPGDLTTLNFGTGLTEQLRIVNNGTINFKFSYTVGMF